MKKYIITLLALLFVTIGVYAITATVNEVSNTVVYRDTTGGIGTANDIFKAAGSSGSWANSSDTWIQIEYVGDTTATFTITKQKASFWSSLFGTTTVSDITVSLANDGATDDIISAWVQAPMGTHTGSDGKADYTVSGDTADVYIAVFRLKK
jgi:hypothetical protein